MTRIKFLLLVGTLILTSCTHTIQASSGADYLSRYNQQPAYTSLSDIDASVREIAAIEPDIRFPARIGLARIEHGQLTTIPADESFSWEDMVDRQGDRYGEFVPISPLITSMVTTHEKGKQINVVNDIRKGAARQHVDYALIYEVTHIDKRRSNDLRFTDATVLGLFLFPSRKVKINTTASAILLDVRNGYPYFTASSFAENKSTVTKAGARSKEAKLADKGRIEAVARLTGEIENALSELKDIAYDQLAAERLNKDLN